MFSWLPFDRSFSPLGRSIGSWSGLVLFCSLFFRFVLFAFFFLFCLEVGLGRSLGPHFLFSRSVFGSVSWSVAAQISCVCRTSGHRSGIWLPVWAAGLRCRAAQGPPALSCATFSPPPPPVRCSPPPSPRSSCSPVSSLLLSFSRSPPLLRLLLPSPFLPARPRFFLCLWFVLFLVFFSSSCWAVWFLVLGLVVVVAAPVLLLLLFCFFFFFPSAVFLFWFLFCFFRSPRCSSA